MSKKTRSRTGREAKRRRRRHERRVVLFWLNQQSRVFDVAMVKQIRFVLGLPKI